MDLIITTHAKERYAERIMDKDTRTDIAVFISNHEDKIRNDITKMVEYGELIYTGEQPTSSKDNKIINIYINGLWVIILDKDNKNVITLFEIDLGVDDELNKIFVSKLLSKLSDNKAHLDEVTTNTINKIDEYNDIVNNNEITIATKKKEIKLLEEQNVAYRELIKSLNANIILAENEVKNTIAKLIGKKF